MSEPTIIALAILLSVFLLMIIVIIKSGVDAAIRMWGVMGALTGVAFGAITTYYFADQSFSAERRVLIEEASGIQKEYDLLNENHTQLVSDVSELMPMLQSYTWEINSKNHDDQGPFELVYMVPAYDGTEQDYTQLQSKIAELTSALEAEG